MLLETLHLAGISSVILHYAEHREKAPLVTALLCGHQEVTCGADSTENSAPHYLATMHKMINSLIFEVIREILQSAGGLGMVYCLLLIIEKCTFP